MLQHSGGLGHRGQIGQRLGRALLRIVQDTGEARRAHDPHSLEVSYPSRDLYHSIEGYPALLARVDEIVGTDDLKQEVLLNSESFASPRDQYGVVVAVDRSHLRRHSEHLLDLMAGNLYQVTDMA